MDGKFNPRPKSNPKPEPEKSPEYSDLEDHIRSISCLTEEFKDGLIEVVRTHRELGFSDSRIKDLIYDILRAEFDRNLKEKKQDSLIEKEILEGISRWTSRLIVKEEAREEEERLEKGKIKEGFDRNFRPN